MAETLTLEHLESVNRLIRAFRNQAKWYEDHAARCENGYPNLSADSKQRQKQYACQAEALEILMRIADVPLLLRQVVPESAIEELRNAIEESQKLVQSLEKAKQVAAKIMSLEVTI